MDRGQSARPADRALRAAPSVHADWDGVWADWSGIHTTHPDTALLEALATASATAPPPIMRPFFAGVGFKGQRREPDLGTAAAQAARHGWIPTTSGVETGVAAHPEAMAAAKATLLAHVPGARLAIASGITAENVADFLPAIDDVLVATGVSRSFHVFDARKLEALADAMRR